MRSEQAGKGVGVEVGGDDLEARGIGGVGVEEERAGRSGCQSRRLRIALRRGFPEDCIEIF